MNKSALRLLGGGLVLTAVGFACGYKSGDLCDNYPCGGGDDAGGDSGGDSGIDIPPGCQLGAEPRDSMACVDDRIGVFVSPTGNDGSGDGTKNKPVASITRGIALANSKKKIRVYICGGPYQEHVTLSSSTSLYGGFACDWQYSGTAVQVTPSDRGIVFTANGVSSITVADIAFAAKSGSDPGESSVAGFISASQGVALRRVTFTAGTGVTGRAGTLTTVSFPTDLVGHDGSGNTGGAPRTCTCPALGSSTGGGGGDVGNAGDAGTANPPTGRDGGGGGASGSCSSGVGNDGSNAPAGADGTSPQALGAISATTGWTPTAGKNGTPGGPGQGGGGGGGPTAAPGAGGSGGCGACGGAAGTGGQGGGGSIALLVWSSTGTTLSACTLATANAGDGASGAGGQTGQSPGGAGGFPDPTSRRGCQGGNGGNGGAGGAGAGGAGGVSVGVLWSGGQIPTLDDATTNAITFGKEGKQGTGGATTPANPGIPGQSGKILQIP